MSEDPKSLSEAETEAAGRRRRADARRNIGSLIQTASEVFAEAGMDVPIREIADRAGVGVGTLYRHF
ncbi:helix-turn-helix domain-containing protein, partial [Rhizobium mayense]